MSEISVPTNVVAAPSTVDTSGRGDQRRRRGKRGGRGRGRGGGPTRCTNDNEQTSGGVRDESGQSTLKSNTRRRGQKGGRDNSSQSNDSNAQASPTTEQAMQFISESLAESNHNVQPTENVSGSNNKQSTRRNRKQRNKKKTDSTADVTNKEAATNVINTNPSAPEEKKKKKRSRNRKPKQRKDQKNYPWKKFIPDGAEDPISLDPLEDLSYPPFALVVDEPYVPIFPGMWPPQEGEEDNEDIGNDVEDEANRELQILKDQWGDKAIVQKKNERTKQTDSDSLATSIRGRRFNLFDGRALANYVVSELQFIDPFNRRDLTRPELQALDAYLAVHKLGAAGVVEAYDDNGTTISTAGAQAQTPGGRALMLQQRAQAIRDLLYQNQSESINHNDMTRVQTWQGNNMGGDNNLDGVTNNFQRMYAAHERGERGVDRSNGSSNRQPSFEPDTGIYAGEEGGFLMIDDDINPGLRSSVVDSTRGSAERISHAAQARDNSFPSLQNNPESVVAAPKTTRVSSKKVPVVDGHSKGLSKIGKMIKQTDPKEVERQRKAREEANRRAELSRQMFFDPSVPNSNQTGTASAGGLLPVPAQMQQNSPSEAVLERNRNLASALGVAPSTVRNNEPSLTGWARPTNIDLQFDEFGNELNAAQYPDVLLTEAKERMSELLKLEKQWKKFLADDKEASCSLKAMPKPLRKFVHEYSDFWRLHTESFDPEGRRYIYCKKMADTAAPHPLLSEAARKWRGPTPGSSSVPAILNTSSSTQMSSTPSDGWRVEGRVPLKLAPRTIDEGTKPPPVVTGMGMTRSSSTPFLSMTGEKPPPPRFANLHENERPKLTLAKRQIPNPDELEKRNLTPEKWDELDDDTKAQIMSEIEEMNVKKQVALEREKKKIDARIHRKEQKAKKKQDVLEKKQALLQSAFDSDDDDEDTDNDWFESDIAFDGSDDEGR